MTDPNQIPKYRLRLTFAKKAQIKYIAHLDVALLWERALRRAQIPLAYSQGFNPQPKMQIASSLPLGTTGMAEIVDIIITRPLEPDEALANIRAALPAGVALHTIELIPLKSPALQYLLRRADYRIKVETALTAQVLTERIDTLLAADKVMQTRRRKKREETFNLRPWLHNLRLESAAEGEACLQMSLSAGQFGNLRPEQVLEALGLAGQWAEIERTHLIFADPDPA